jgi:hypothetical protein
VNISGVVEVASIMKDKFDADEFFEARNCHFFSFFFSPLLAGFWHKNCKNGIILMTTVNK